MALRDYNATGQMLGNDPFGFTGGLDAGNGKWKLGARFYDSGSSSFMQQDRYLGDASDPLSLNRYSYCGLDPVNFVDPTGFKAYGISFGADACLYIGGKVKASWVWDNHGNFGLLFTAGFSVGAKGSIGGFHNLTKLFSPGGSGFAIPGANTIYDLAGWGKEFSGSLLIGELSVDDKGNLSGEFAGDIGIGCSYTWSYGVLVPLGNTNDISQAFSDFADYSVDYMEDAVTDLYRF